MANHSILLKKTEEARLGWLFSSKCDTEVSKDIIKINIFRLEVWISLNF
jgi:hypothetical protein